MSVPVPPWRRAPRPVPSRPPLSQESIVGAALAILDREGLDAVTTRRVAQALGTGPASLYAHISSKDELHELVLDRVLGEVTAPAPDPARWQEQIKELVRSTLRVLDAHPGIARVMVAHIPTAPNALRITEGTLAILRAGRLPDQIAAYAVDLLNLYGTAVAVETCTYVAQGMDEASSAARLAQIGDYFASLPAALFPNLIALRGLLMHGGGDERFEFGLDILVRGLAAWAEPPAASAGDAALAPEAE